MITEGIYSELYFHIDCLNSKEGKRWRVERARTDKLYARYLELISHGRVVKCPACHTECAIYFKSRDVPHVWELSCDVCGKVNLDGLSIDSSDDEKQLIKELKSLEIDFLRAEDKSIDVRIEAISNLSGSFGRCECGGLFVIAAPPRCSCCYTPLLQSYFHYSQCEERFKGAWPLLSHLLQPLWL
jgi:hypothetical protein